MSARRDLAALVPEGERVVLTIKPGLLSIVARRAWWHVTLIVVVVSMVVVPGAAPAVWALAAVVAAMVAWDALVWASRRYVLTDRRIAASSGVLHRRGVSIPLERVQHTVVSRTIVERLTGLGTLGVATAGTGTIELAWVMIDRPRGTLARIRDEVDRARALREAPGARDRGGAP